MKLLLAFLFLVSCSTTGLRFTEIETQKPRSQYEAFSKNIMISTQGEYSTKAGEEIYKLGGNIFDIATAVTFVISVERPQSTGIGGGGFLLSHFKDTKETVAFDFREVAPKKAYERMFLDKSGKQIPDKSLTGSFAVGVPGLVKGIVELHEQYGKLPLSQVIAPAVRLARDGFKVYPFLASALESEKERLARYPSSKKIFFKDGDVLKEGDLLVQKDLAHTLELIGQNGTDGFYKGSVANKIIKTMKDYKGLITQDDLDSYTVKKREPVYGTYKGTKIASMPPPSSGGVHIIQILNLLEPYNLKQYGQQSAKSIHLTASAMQMAFSDRANYMGDADFKNVPVEELISKKYADNARSLIKEDKANPATMFPKSFKDIYESTETTHFTIMDSQGNVVSSTQTINGYFGSALVAEGTGILLNNEMDDFSSHVGGVNLFGAIGGKNNLVEPMKRPLSSMSPTILFNEKDEPFMALGTPSGTRILTCVMQTILNTLEYKMPLWEAVSATRIHQQWYPDELWIESPYVSEGVEKELVAMGHNVVHKPLGCKIQAVKLKNKTLHGVSDPREEGMSLGL